MRQETLAYHAITIDKKSFSVETRTNNTNNGNININYQTSSIYSYHSPDQSPSSSSDCIYSPFKFLDKCLLYFPTYITENRGKLRNIICIGTIVLLVTLSIWQVVAFYFNNSIIDATIQYVMILLYFLNSTFEYTMLYFMSQKLPKISQLFFRDHDRRARMQYQ